MHAADGRAERIAQLRRFVELLLQWNRRVSNLISKNDESRVVEAHLAPSLEPAEWIASHRLSRWLDFGSGGGFPAIPLALCGVGDHWDLVESRRTKTLFLRRAVQELGLAGVRVITERLENLVARKVVRAADSGADSVAGSAADRESEWQTNDAEDDSAYGDASEGPKSAGPVTGDSSESLAEQYDGITSRATLALGPTLELAARIVRPGGFAFLWKGSKLDEELSKAPMLGSKWVEGERRSLSNGLSTVIKLKRIAE